MKRFDYTNKTAIITGASSGIGREIAKRLTLDYGCTVYAIARQEEKLKRLKEEIGNNLISYPMDVSFSENWEKLREHFEALGKKADILINCAGFLPPFAGLENTEIGVVREAMEVNFFSSVYSAYTMLPVISEGGIIVNVSSASALCPFAGISAYSASKAALQRFTECISCEVKKVSILSVMPGFVKTDIMKNQTLNEKDRGLIKLFSADLDKTVNKMLKRIRKRKKRIVIGTDAHLMSIMYRFFPSLTPVLISKIIKKSKLELFDKV